MKLHDLVNRVSKEEAVALFLMNKSVVCLYDGESYLVDHFGIFDKIDVVFYTVDYTRLDIISLIERFRENNCDLCPVSQELYYGNQFTNMQVTSNI